MNGLVSHLPLLLEDDDIGLLFRPFVVIPKRSRHTGSAFEEDRCTVLLSRKSTPISYEVTERELATVDIRLRALLITRSRTRPTSRTRERHQCNMSLKRAVTTWLATEPDIPHKGDESSLNEVTGMDLDVNVDSIAVAQVAI